MIGGERCSIVDTWWQTETGAIMISALPGLTATKPGSATRPLPGVSAALFGDAGDEIGQGSGVLVLTQPLAQHAAHPLRGTLRAVTVATGYPHSQVSADDRAARGTPSKPVMGVRFTTANGPRLW